MKKLLLSVAMITATMAMAQVGINNESPQATLDVTAKTTDGTKPEGIIAPRLTGDQIQGKDVQYDTAQKGTIVYATAALTLAPTTKTANITAEGYYYFDGAVWVKFNAPGTEPWYVANIPSITTQATSNTQDIFQSGKVGIGTTTPISKLQVYENNTVVPAGNYPTILSQRHLNLGNATTNISYRAGQFTLDLDPASTTIFDANTITPMRVGVSDPSASNYTTSSGPDKGGIIGIYNLNQKTGSGTIDQLSSEYNLVQVRGSVISNLTMPNRTLVDLTSSQKQPVVTISSNEIGGNSVIGNLTFYDAMANTITLGAVDNVYGYKVSTSLTGLSSPNKWAFYNDANIPSYFKGRVGIGTNSPTTALQVVGLTEYVDNAAAITAGLTAGAFYRTGDLLKVVH